MPAPPEYLQRDQPEGVPPLALTGERTLPDVPAENYWYRRHLAVYEWIAPRCSGLTVVDLACGEGYGTEVLARRAPSVTGVDANPDAYEHARLRYSQPGVRFVRDLVDRYSEPCDAVVFLQTIEHVPDPAAVLRHVRAMLRPGGTAYVSTPNVLTLAPEGEQKSANPWHVREYRHEEFRALCERCFDDVDLLGLFHARKLRVHELALRLGWDAAHARLRLTRPFYDRFNPAIAASDFVLRPAPGAGAAGGAARDATAPHRPATAPLDRALDFLAVLR